MKRGFRFGLGSFLIIAAIAGLIGAVVGTVALAGVIMAFVCMPLSILVIRAANSAPFHRSRLHAVVGWFRRSHNENGKKWKIDTVQYIQWKKTANKRSRER